MALAPASQPISSSRPPPSLRPEGLAATIAAARAAKVRPLLLFVLVTAFAAVDWWLPLDGLLAWVTAGALSLSTLPWLAVVLRREPNDAAFARAADLRTSRRVGILASVLFHGTLLVFLLGFVGAKWLVLLRARENPEAFVGSSRSYTLALLLVYGAGLLGRGLRLERFVALAAKQPARLMALSFGALGLFGALVLSLPVSAARMSGVSLVDNLFMAFSAVCVTGLASNVISEQYSLFGQAVLCLLVQAGGLGIMVLSAAIMTFAGRRMGVRSSAMIAQMVDASSIASLRRTLVNIVAYTLLIEAAGAALLYWRFAQHGSELAGEGGIAWAAIFHAVSAFCNAGMSSLSTGLIPLRSEPIVTAVIAMLVVLGGIGFPVLDELARAAFDKLRRRRLQAFSLNTRVVLYTSGLLLAGMALAYVVFEWNASMKELAWYERVMAAIFQSAVVRSAGFNLVDIGAMTPATLVLTCAAMFIGASPGSTGGGIKTTTLAALFAGMRAELGTRAPYLLDRSLPLSLIRKAIGVAFLSMLIVFGVVVVMLVLERQPPLALMFEVVSAFSTTGLSTGITPELTAPGKLVIAVTMFVGRIGPLTFALALSLSQKPEPLELPAERVMIG